MSRGVCSARGGKVDDFVEESKTKKSGRAGRWTKEAISWISRAAGRLNFRRGPSPRPGKKSAAQPTARAAARLYKIGQNGDFCRWLIYIIRDTFRNVPEVLFGLWWQYGYSSQNLKQHTAVWGKILKKIQLFSLIPPGRRAAITRGRAAARAVAARSPIHCTTSYDGFRERSDLTTVPIFRKRVKKCRGVKGERMMIFTRLLMLTDKIKYRLADFNFLFHLIKHALLVKIEPQNCLLWIVKHVFVSVS